MDDSVDGATTRWSDKLELAELVAVLSSAVDRADRSRIATCYAEDSFDDHGTFRERAPSSPTSCAARAR